MEIRIKIFRIDFNTHHNKSYICNLKNEKAFELWESYFATKQPEQKFHFFCSGSNNKLELEASLKNDLLEVTNNCQYDIDRSCFDSLDKITVCGIL